MKERLIALILFFLLIWTSLPGIGAEITELNLQSSIRIVLEENLDLKLEKLNLENAKFEYQKKKANNLLSQSQYSELEADYSFLTVKNTYQSVYDNLVKETIKQYTDIWLRDLDIIIKGKKLELERLLLEEKKAQYEISDIGSIELLEQENTYKDVQFSLETARDDYHQTIKEFSTGLNLDNTELILSELIYKKPLQINESEAIENALENSLLLSLKRKKVELAEIDLERSEVSAAELDKKIKENSREKARLEVEISKKELINNVQQAYYQFKKSVNKIDLTGERLIEAEEKYKMREEQFKTGLITKLEVLEYEINMLQEKYNYLSAIADYYLSEQTLRQNMGIKSGVLLNETPEN